MTFVFLGSHAEKQGQEGRKQTGRKRGGTPGGCIFSCALPPSSVGRRLGRRAQGQMAAAGARAWRAARGSSRVPHLRAAKAVTTSHQSNQRCQSVGSVPGPCSAWPLSPKGTSRIITGHLSCGKQPRGRAHPILQDACLSWHKFPYQCFTHPRGNFPAGTGAEHAAAMN